MFAVPGWSIQASSLKRQTDVDVPKQLPGQANNQGQDGKSHSRKRKRKPKPDNANEVEHNTNGNDNDQNVSTDRRSDTESRHKKRKTENPESVNEDEKKSDKSNEQNENSTISKKKQKMTSQSHGAVNSSSTTVSTSKSNPTAPKTTAVSPAPALTPLQQKMRQKLVSARFRHLNEQLYTTPSATSLSLFSENPAMFDDYHSGFRQQVSVWPLNPVDVFISTIQSRSKIKSPSFSSRKNQKPKSTPSSSENGNIEALPRTKGQCIIADLGCGDATLGRTLLSSKTCAKNNVQVLSYDIGGSADGFVTRADIANLSLSDGSVDVAIFCLALMGTNWIDFVEEAWRVLHWKGELWIAEIKSRFVRKGEGRVVDHSVGKRRKEQGSSKNKGKKSAEEEKKEDAELRVVVDGEEVKEETDISAFEQVLLRRGFILRKGKESVDLSNKMFVRMEFIKAAAPTVGKNVKITQGDDERTGKKKFVDVAPADVSVESEAAVLKPCLYKIR